MTSAASSTGISSSILAMESVSSFCSICRRDCGSVSSSTTAAFSGGRWPNILSLSSIVNSPSMSATSSGSMSRSSWRIASSSEASRYPFSLRRRSSLISA